MTTTQLNVYEPYQDIRTELAELATANENAVFDYEDPKGEKMARSHIASLRSVNGAIDRKTKELKAEALEYNRRVEAARRELKAEVAKMIAVHETPLLEIKQREADRKAKIQEAIDTIEAAAMYPGGADSKIILKAIGDVSSIDIDADTYEERMAEAVKIKEQKLASLQGEYEQAAEQEAKDAELERLRREKEERERKEREAKIACEAAEKAQREAEVKAQQEREEAERKVQAEREEAARRERELKEQAERAEAERQAAIEQAEREKQEAIEYERRHMREAEEERAREAAEQRAADEKRAANKRHRAKVVKRAVEALAEHTGLDTEACGQVIQAIEDLHIPNVTIGF